MHECWVIISKLKRLFWEHWFFCFIIVLDFVQSEKEEATAVLQCKKILLEATKINQNFNTQFSLN